MKITSFIVMFGLDPNIQTPFLPLDSSFRWNAKEDIFYVILNARFQRAP